MKNLPISIVFIFMLILGVMAFSRPLYTTAQSATCKNGSTQSRVQTNSSSPWSPSLNLKPGESFNVGSFHNGTGQFATDTTLLVTGPGGYQVLATNGQTIKSEQEGYYVLRVFTREQWGAGCEEMSLVYVSKNTPLVTLTPTSGPVYTPSSAPIPTGTNKKYNFIDVNGYVDANGVYLNNGTLEVTDPTGYKSTYTGTRRPYAWYSGTYTFRLGDKTGSIYIQ